MQLPAHQSLSNAAGAGVTVFTQLLVLSKRALLMQWRDVMYNIPRLFLAIMIAVLFGLIYFRLDRQDFASMQVCEYLQVSAGRGLPLAVHGSALIVCICECHARA